MATKPPGRNRPVDVDIRPFLPEFLERLSRATNWDRHSECIRDAREVIPGAYQGSWDCDSPGRFAVDYLWQELLSKYDDGKPSPEKEKVTWQRFFAAEDACAKTNMNLTRYASQYYSTRSTGAWSLIEAAKQEIAQILGKFCWDEVRDRMQFTSGASTRLPRASGQPVYKYSGIPETTFDNLALAQAIIRSVPLWEKRLIEGESLNLSVVTGNKIIRVAKNYKTDRTIAVEPELNMYAQKGLGNVIRSRLRKAGMDLSSQRTNQDLALLGSVTGMVATIDMSMASDTVSIEAVRLMLPPEWCAALEQCRSSQGVLPSGEKLLYRKFSSMGNGYTFELESLIFYGLALAVTRAFGASTSYVSIHGDDLIVPTTVARPMLDLLQVMGFTTNENKTFIDGQFRESCGKHYLAGFDVTPFYIKEQPRRLTDLFLLHNKLYRWLWRQGWNTWIDSDAVRDILRWLRSLAPSNWRRPRIPHGMGDGAFIGTFDECLPSTPACTYRPGRVGKRDGWEGWMVDVLIEVTPVAVMHDGQLFVRKSDGITPIDPRVKPRHTPDESGWLLESIEPSGLPSLSYLDPEDSRGGISLSPRVRVVRMLVPRFDWPQGQYFPY